MASIEDTGIVIDTLDEVLADIDAEFRDEFGTGVTGIDLSPQSFTGRQNPIIARRIVETQQLVADAFSLINPNNAQGRILDFLGTLLGEQRLAATNATIQCRCYGAPGFLIGDRRVRYVRNGTIWRVPLGTVVEANGTVDVALVCDVAGTTLPSDGILIEAYQDGSDQWVIVDNNVSFFAVESTGDYSAGTTTESNNSYRQKLALAGSSATSVATKPGIDRALARVAGNSVRVDNNRDLVPNANGTPGKSVHVITDEGVESEIVQAIYDSFSDTAGFFGSTTAYAVDRNGSPVAVQYTPAERVEIEWNVEIDPAGGSVALPDNAVSLVQAALAEYTNTTLKIDMDVQPEEGAAVVRTALPKGCIPDGQLTIEVGLKGGSLGTTTIPMTLTQRARTDAAEQSAKVLGTEGGPFNLLATQVLQLSADGGTAQNVTMMVSDFAAISAATVLEVATIINNRMTGFVAGTENGALVIRSATAGASSSVNVGTGSTAGLLTALGLVFGTESGSDGDITVTIV